MRFTVRNQRRERFDRLERLDRVERPTQRDGHGQTVTQTGEWCQPCVGSRQPRQSVECIYESRAHRVVYGYRCETWDHRHHIAPSPGSSCSQSPSPAATTVHSGSTLTAYLYPRASIPTKTSDQDPPTAGPSPPLLFPSLPPAPPCPFPPSLPLEVGTLYNSPPLHFLPRPCKQGSGGFSPGKIFQIYMTVREILCISRQNMTTQQTHCFGCRQFETRHILKLYAIWLCAESQGTNSGDWWLAYWLIKSKIMFIWQI